MTTAAIAIVMVLAAVLFIWARRSLRRARREAAEAQARLEAFISYHDRRRGRPPVQTMRRP
jgi:type II secretory pathway pseudopilin PulG